MARAKCESSAMLFHKKTKGSSCFKQQEEEDMDRTDQLLISWKIGFTSWLRSHIYMHAHKQAAITVCKPSIIHQAGTQKKKKGKSNSREIEQDHQQRAHADHHYTISPHLTRRARKEGGDRGESVEPVVAVGLEHGAAEGADDGAPCASVHGEEVADPGGGLHVRHARAPAAPRADPRRRLAAPHRPPLVHQEAEEHHRCLPFWFLLSCAAGSALQRR